MQIKYRNIKKPKGSVYVPLMIRKSQSKTITTKVITTPNNTFLAVTLIGERRVDF